MLAYKLIEAQNLARARVLLLPYKLLLALILVVAQIPVLLIIIMLLTNLEAFIYYIILMLMYKVEPEPGAENSSLFRLRA